MQTSHNDARSDAVQRAVNFLDYLFQSPRTFDIRLWDGTCLSSNESPKFTLAITSPGALKRMFSLPVELKLGEAYVRGDFVIEGNDFVILDALHEFSRAGVFAAVNHMHSFSSNAYQLTRLTEFVKRWRALPEDFADAKLTRSEFNPPEQRYSKKRSRDAVQYHYDVNNEFYALWLDKRMVYSCAYFTDPGEDIHTAQENKLDYLCRKLQLKSGERLLDVGCGWGGLVIHAAKKFGVKALGITLSKQQFELASQRVKENGLEDQITLKMMDYHDVRGEKFDKAVSVGMFEHVGRNHLSTYFKTIFEALRPGGLFMNQGISSTYEAPKPIFEQFVERYIVGRGIFAMRYVLPDGDVIPLSSVNIHAEYAGFEVRDVENIRDHWGLTLRAWIRRLEENEKEAIRMVGEHAYRIWRIYLYASLVGFEAGSINECQTLLAKPNNGLSEVPLTRVGQTDFGRTDQLLLTGKVKYKTS